jgi:hypothetical protein
LRYLDDKLADIKRFALPFRFSNYPLRPIRFPGKNKIEKGNGEDRRRIEGREPEAEGLDERKYNDCKLSSGPLEALVTFVKKLGN